VEVVDLVRQGATAVAGDSRQDVPGNPTHIDILYGAYLAGANAVEAFYLSMPYLSANTIIIGDPLCAPFRPLTLTRSDIEGGEDPETSLPRLFAERRMGALRAAMPYVPPAALALTLRAAEHVARGERHLARVVLEQATEIAPKFASAQFNLGTLNQIDGDFDLAIQRYRLAIEAQRPPARDEFWEIFGPGSALPVRVAALNNLAYVLAVNLHKPAEALPFATKATADAGGDPSVVDTLAWIEFLLEDSSSAATHVREALVRGRLSATIHLHAAAIFAATGARAEAEEHLKEALRLQPELDGSGAADGIRAQIGSEGAATVKQ
jgi:tetratricopeptide (TPR) repeat protein